MTAQPPGHAEVLYSVHGYYLDADGWLSDPERNYVHHANLTGRQVLASYATADELDQYLDDGAMHHTSRACLGWYYRITTQTEPLKFNPATQTWETA